MHTRTSRAVTTSEERETDDDGRYFHSACLDSREHALLLGGRTHMSARQLDEAPPSARVHHGGGRAGGLRKPRAVLKTPLADEEGTEGTGKRKKAGVRFAE